MKIIRPTIPTQAPEAQPAAPAAVPARPLPETHSDARSDEREKELQLSLEVFKAQINTLRNELEQLSAFRAKDDEQLRHNARTMQALNEEIASLKKTVLETPKPKDPPPPIQKVEPLEEIKLIEVKPMPMPEPKPAAMPEPALAPIVEIKPEPKPAPAPVLEIKPEPKPAPVQEQKPAPSREWMEALSDSKPSGKNERKVALLSKLWNYLNHVAVEIPLRKPDRND